MFTGKNGHVSRGVNVKLYTALTKAFGVINGELDPNKSQARRDVAYHVDWVPEDYRDPLQVHPSTDAS